MIQVRLQFFGDINPFKDSSAGVQFFTIKRTPPTYEVLAVLGFVGALDTGDDPEYHWSDNFRWVYWKGRERSRRVRGKDLIFLKSNLKSYHHPFSSRAPRTSNESRTRIMFRLSGQLLRQ